MCECGGAVISTNSKVNKPGSSGIPLPHVVVSAFDISSNKELPYGERGELRVQTPCAMLGYFADQKATDTYFWTDVDGVRWACTGDMGYVTEEGCVYVDGRISDSYIDAKREVVYLFDIERAILDIDCVRQCKAVACDVCGETTHVCHITLAPGTNSDVTACEIEERCANVLSPSHFPRWVRFYDEALPVAPSGKLDVVRMKANSEDRQELRYIEKQINRPSVHMRQKLQCKSRNASLSCPFPLSPRCGWGQRSRG